MSTWKLVSGILSCVLFVIIVFQSCAAGLGEAMGASGTSSGSGILVAILVLAGGIVSIAVRKSLKKGGDIAILVLNLIAALIGFTSDGIYEDLKVWSVWCLICAILALVSMVKKPKGDHKTNE